MVPKRQTQTKQKYQEQIWAAPPLDPPAAQPHEAGALQGLNLQLAESRGPGSGRGLGVLGEPLPFRKKHRSIKITRNVGSNQVLFTALPQLALSLCSLMCFWGAPDVAGLVTGPRDADSSAHPAWPQTPASSKAILGAEDLTQGQQLGGFCLKSTFIRVVMTLLGCSSMSPAKQRCGHLVARSSSSNGVQQVPTGKQILTLGVHCWHGTAPRMALGSLQGGGILL